MNYNFDGDSQIASRVLREAHKDNIIKSYLQARLLRH